MFLRNILYHEQVISVYPTYPFSLITNFMRCSYGYLEAKGEKPLYRILFFNMIRCLLPEILLHLTF